LYQVDKEVAKVLYLDCLGSDLLRLANNAGQSFQHQMLLSLAVVLGEFMESLTGVIG